MQNQECFVSADKEMVIETLQIQQISNHQSFHKLCKKQNQLVWRFQSIKNNKVPQRKVQQKNISFQTQEYSFDELRETNSDSDQKQYRSSLAIKYKFLDQVYTKQRNIGSTFIGNREYFASVFIETEKIIKSKFNPFPPLNKKNTNKLNEMNCCFDSNFQSGNLFAVYKVSKNEYDLLLQNDINTKGNTQWFYFRMTNIKPKQNIKINIVNLMKSDSLFNYGMLPCVHSLQSEIHSGQGWVRRGTNVTYTKNQNQIENSRRHYYTLSFTINTQYSNDILRIAHCYPYTLTDFDNFMSQIMNNNEKKNFIERQSLGQTIGKNRIQLLTIMEPNPRKKNRDIIVIIARQHAGETPSSYVCEGLINYLLSNDREAEYLRKNCEFKIIPMVNPDGVYFGNYRTNLLGVDLNRRWCYNQKNSNLLESIIVKNYLNELGKRQNINYILDLHGHSRKLFSFFYGNPNTKDPLLVRSFPYVCSKISNNIIRYQDSTFVYSDNKRKTARIQLSTMFKIPNIFTFEVSFFGFINKDGQKKHFTQESYRHLGWCLGKSIFIEQRNQNSPQSKEALIYSKIINDLKFDTKLLQCGKCGQQSGSQSNPSECQLDQKQQLSLQQKQKNVNNKIIKKQFIKKVIKREIFSKQISRQTRVMQILDMPRVHSIFPNEALSLVPNSYLPKDKKNLKDASTQSDEVPFLKIYQACKAFQMHSSQTIETYPQRKSQLVPHKISNLFKTVIRPRSSTYNNHLQKNSPFSKKLSNEIQNQKQRFQSGDVRKLKNPSKTTKNIQTELTFSPKFEFQTSYLTKNKNQKSRDLLIGTIDDSRSTPKIGFKTGFKTINADNSKKKRLIY